MFPGHELSILKVKLLERIGSTKLGPEDCSKISVEIFLTTGHYVSKSTIKRIFGIAPTLSDSSKFVKDAISNFLGFKNWETLQQTFHRDE